MKDRTVDIEIISSHINNLLIVAKEVISSEIKFDPNDHFAFMSLSFLTKQIEHCRSIMILISGKQYSDSMIIARTMLEGLIIIAWCHKNNPNHYGDLWSRYAVVADYKLYLKKNKSEISPEIANDIFARLDYYGSIFLTKKARKIKDTSLSPSQYSFTNKWLIDEQGNEIKISRMFEEIDGHLQNVYRDISGWIHWDISSIGQNIKHNAGIVQIAANNLNDGALALAIAFQSLFGLLEMVDFNLGLGFKPKFETIRLVYLQDISNLKSNTAEE
ncbi:MAG TPA: hypothetical protein DHV28_00330 [Ignavibacteriales bacterium]|nr:hypothetical protein [Ignavibacteriales bacterium]